MQNCSKELCAKFSNPKISSSPIESLTPKMDYLLISLMDFLVIFGLRNSFLPDVASLNLILGRDDGQVETLNKPRE